MRFWLDLMGSIPRSLSLTLAEFPRRRLLWLTPLVLFLLLITVLLLVVGSIQPLAPFIYSLI